MTCHVIVSHDEDSSVRSSQKISAMDDLLKQLPGLVDVKGEWMITC